MRGDGVLRARAVGLRYERSGEPGGSSSPLVFYFPRLPVLLGRLMMMNGLLPSR